MSSKQEQGSGDASDGDAEEEEEVDEQLHRRERRSNNRHDVSLASMQVEALDADWLTADLEALLRGVPASTPSSSAGGFLFSRMNIFPASGVGAESSSRVGDSEGSRAQPETAPSPPRPPSPPNALEDRSPMGTEGTKSPPGTGREGATAGTDPPPAVVVPPVAGGEVGRGEVDSRPVAGSGGVAPTDAVDEAPSGSSATCGEERTEQQSVTSPGSDGAEGRGEATVSAGVEAVPDPTVGFPVISVVGAGSSPASSSDPGLSLAVDGLQALSAMSGIDARGIFEEWMR